MDSMQTKEGAVALSSEYVRSSTRSTRRMRNKSASTPNALAAHLRSNGKTLGEGIYDIYKHLVVDSPTFFAFFARDNIPKNKYPDQVFLADRTRVILDGKPDYYHASYVDGCTLEKQYILAQAPFDDVTAVDFYRMVYQTRPEAIVVLMKLSESDSKDYMLPNDSGDIYGTLKVKIEKVKSTGKYGIYTVTLNKEKGNKSEKDVVVSLLSCDAWIDDDEVPIPELIEFHKIVHKRISGKPRECAQLIMCPTGALRSAVYVILDIEAERLQTTGRIRLTDTVRMVRSQRANALESFELFIGLLNLLVAYARTYI